MTHSHDHGTKPATDVTAAVNEAAVGKYAMDDRDDFHDVERGFIAGWGEKLYSDDGLLIFDGEALSTSTTTRPRRHR